MSVFEQLQLWNGFRAVPEGVIGIKDGVPLLVSEARQPQQYNLKVLRLAVRTPDEATSQAAIQALRKTKGLPKARFSDITPTGLTLDFDHRLSKKPDAAERLQGVLDVILPIVGAVRPLQGAELSVVDGIPDLLTASERESITAAYAEAGAAYEALPARIGTGMLGALIGAVVTAVAWALLLAYADLQHWIVAVLGGALVAYLAVRFSGKVTWPLRIVVFAFTLLGVFAGEILGTALYIWQDFGVFDLAGSYTAYMAAVAEDSQFAGQFYFALAGGAIGALLAMFRFSKPEFNPAVAAR